MNQFILIDGFGCIYISFKYLYLYVGIYIADSGVSVVLFVFAFESVPVSEVKSKQCASHVRNRCGSLSVY